MIKFWVFLLALLGLFSISYTIHETVHWVGVEEPVRVCFGMEGDLDDPASVSGAKVYFEGREFWYGSEWVAYGLQALFCGAGIILLIKKG